MKRCGFALALFLLLLAFAGCEKHQTIPNPPPPAPISHYPGFELLRTFPHASEAFTQGLTFGNGRLFESTGIYGQSEVRELDAQTGSVLRQSALAPEQFGEGLMLWSNQLIQLTWKAGVARILDRDSFRVLDTFSYPGEGWGLTHDGRHWFLSDGSAQIRILDPTTREETGRLDVTENGKPLANLNELEYANGWILANIWQSDRIVAIRPETGEVGLHWSLSPLWQRLPLDARPDVLNGIAWLPHSQTVLVTGKWWPQMFEIRLDGFPP